MAGHFGWTVSLLAVLAPAATGLAASADLGGPHPAAGIRLSPFDNQRLRLVVERASRRLDKASCRRVFSEFTDTAGLPLQTRLDALGVPSAEYLALLGFADGSPSPACGRPKVVAFTSPGSRVVSVCVRPFFAVAARDPVEIEAIVIHEMLHTLGLGEDPPSSAEITRSVLRRCH